eukprot:gene8933-16565_t
MEDKKWKTNWAKCCLCQKDNKEDLKSPASNPATREKDGYHNIATNVPLFLAINSLPIALDPERLDEGNGIEETLRHNNAMYHQSCRSLFSNTKFERARSVGESSGLVGEGRSKKQRKSVSKDVCFLCDEEEKEGALRKLNERLNQCSRILSDGKLLALLSAGDAVAQDLMYHPKCLGSLYNRVRSHLATQNDHLNHDEDSENQSLAVAFSELVTYIIESCNSGEGPHTFRLADLVLLYKQRVEQQIGVDKSSVNSTRLKEQLLLHLPELEAYHKG